MKNAYMANGNFVQFLYLTKNEYCLVSCAQKCRGYHITHTCRLVVKSIALKKRIPVK